MVFHNFFRLDRNPDGYNITINGGEDIPTKELRFLNFPYDRESFFLEVNLLNWKWLLCGYYHLSNHQDNSAFNKLGNELNKYIQVYEKFIFIGDFNAETLKQVYLNFYMNT